MNLEAQSLSLWCLSLTSLIMPLRLRPGPHPSHCRLLITFTIAADLRTGEMGCAIKIAEDPGGGAA
jgi:hypothetical protein